MKREKRLPRRLSMDDRLIEENSAPLEPEPSRGAVSSTSSRRRFIRTGAAAAGAAAAAVYVKPDLRSFGIPEVLAASATGAITPPGPGPAPCPAGTRRSITGVCVVVPTNKDECKSGGYARFIDPSTGQPFRNQGQCQNSVN
jgi:hypothetical protein